MGRILLIVYGLFGMPLTLVTLADLARFLGNFVLTMVQKFKSVMGRRKGRKSAANADPQMPTVPIGFILLLLLAYPFLGGIIFSMYAGWPLVDAFYFSLVTIFTIGFGDLPPPIHPAFLICFIVGGVILVTMCVEFVGAQAIHQIHFMGRQAQRAKDVANRLAKIAQHINNSVGLNLSSGLAQMGAFARFGILMKVDADGKRIDNNANVHPGRPGLVALSGAQTVSAFAPDDADDFNFVDLL
uniref:Potassium channel domain-containing protein n=1 Tax=Plectus sambesii TaxID=2011161 RepID=A0A914X6D1_9BILA